MSRDTQVKQEAPGRIFLKACHPDSPNHNCTWSVSKEPKDSVEYVRADLLATVRREVFKEAIEVARGDIPAASSYNVDYRRGGRATQQTIVRRLEASASEKGEMNG